MKFVTSVKHLGVCLVAGTCSSVPVFQSMPRRRFIEFLTVFILKVKALTQSYEVTVELMKSYCPVLFVSFGTFAPFLCSLLYSFAVFALVENKDFKKM